MNKLVIILLAGFLSFVGQSQDLTFPNWTDTVVGATTDWEVTSYEKDVINTSGMVLSLKVEKNPLVTIGTTDYYFCWGLTCQDADDTISSETVIIAPNDTNGTFISYARIKSDGGNAGISTIEYCFFETTGTIADFCINQYYDVSYVNSITEMNVKSSHIAFNIISSKNNMLISLDKESRNIQVSVYDINGRLVAQQYSSNSRDINLSTAGLPNGSYIVNVLNGNESLGSKNIILLQ
ncbi:MAG: T9SS type A sorting domain-containing protein [Flavobacteriales bacterium]|nr:T9SS type A sorting domain-containing protein [Flavobacteriales bacterium]